MDVTTYTCPNFNSGKFRALMVNKTLRSAVARAAAAYELVQKHKVTPVYQGDLITRLFSWNNSINMPELSHFKYHA